MTTSNNPYGNATGPAPAKRAESKARRWLKLVFLALVLSGIYIAYNLSLLTMPMTGPVARPDRAQDEDAQFKLADDKLQHELVLVIQSQLAAFRQDDYTMAYAFAAADFKSQISLEAFEKMVKSAFPQLARSRSAEYGVVMARGDIAKVEVTIVGETGTRIHYQYILHREPGGWKIGGVNEGTPEKVFI